MTKAKQQSTKSILNKVQKKSLKRTPSAQEIRAATKRLRSLSSTIAAMQETVAMKEERDLVSALKQMTIGSPCSTPPLARQVEEVGSEQCGQTATGEERKSEECESTSFQDSALVSDHGAFCGVSCRLRSAPARLGT
ncbi:predicted protein [Lichtheimia corymbifera JMRC:FSU:9682]|uniref:Uncharacterized protein n=1 Tax=Lichtheimia corymbifera JMRC:FSU:9682 TaxID=1263082 RepID=A0A068SHI9_9FUNG|nr:predicted protein [Lichtheimia corymbifera JMRC:FSU:9682]